MLLTDVIRVMTLVRFGVSVPEELLQSFDHIVDKRKYVGRSGAIRDAMRAYISQAEWDSAEGVNTATLNVVYHHTPKLMSDLIKIQHQSGLNVLSSVHVHMTRTHCLEVITMRGTKESIESLADRISGLSGVDYSRLFMFSLPGEVEEGQHHH